MALQGTPKDYSTMVVAAKKLGQAAEAKKAAEEEKRRQKIMSDVYKTGKGMPVLPVRQKQVDNITADLIDELMNAEQVDYGQLANKMMKFEQNISQMNAEYKAFQKFAPNPLQFGIDPRDVAALQTIDDDDELRKSLKIIKFTDDGRIAFNPIDKFKPSSVNAQEYVTKFKDRIYNDVVPKQQKIGNKTIQYFEVPENVTTSFVETQLSNPIAVENIRREMIFQDKPLPQQGTPEEKKVMSDYLTEQFNTVVEPLLSTNSYTVRPFNVNINMGEEKANVIQPNAGNLTKVKIRTKTKEGNNYDNVTSFTYRILNATPNKRNINPNDVEIIDTETGRAGGKPKGELGNGAIDLLAVFTRPYTATFTLPGGQKETVQFNKGDMAPDFLMTSDMSNYIQMKPYQIGIDINDKTYYIPFGSADELAMVLNEKKSNEGFTSTMMDVVNKSKADLQSQIGQGMDKFYSNFENFLGKSVKPQQGQNTIQQNINDVGTGKLTRQQKVTQPTQKPSTSGTKKISSETKKLFQ